MDTIDTERGKPVKDIPPVPIKTYKWEDVRRAKLRGLYPYTHLYKDPFNEDIDPDQFKMEAAKKEMRKSSSGVDIQEINEESKNHEHEGIVEYADSSADDNISQYLDKDEKMMNVEEIPSTSTDQNLKVEEENRANRAKSEEPKRKRKLSIESAYSRISLPKFNVIKKLRAAKDRLKIPKLNFSKSEPKLSEKKKKGKSSKEVLKECVEPKQVDEKPLYIHIPLKPPPGETDEFSYLEFEDPSAPLPVKKEVEDTKPVESKPSSPNGITNDVQFIILTAPSDDEVLDDQVIVPDSASSGDQKFFDGTKLKELKTIAKGCMDDIAPDTKIDGIIFEDVIQVEYVDEHNNPIGTTERSNFLEINEATLPTIEKQLSERNILEEIQKEVTSSMDSINKLVRNRSLRSSPNRSRSSEALKLDLSKTQEAPELSSLPNMNRVKKTMSLKETRRPKPLIHVDKKDTLKEKTDESKDKELINEKNQSEQKDNITRESEEEAKPKEQKIIVDEEDGLKMINQELPKTTDHLKTDTKGESLKKKVSFKRKSKQEDPDGVYEDVKVTDGKDGKLKDLKVIESGQSMSVDEEKTYLDEKIIKSASLEEDYNKWSKITDHEYEPVNPPPNDGQVPTTQPEIKTTEIVQKPSPTSKITSIRIPLHDDVIVQDEPQAETEEIPFQDQSLQPETSLPTTAASKPPEESQAKKIQEAFRSQAGKIRTKFKNMKKPNISMPQKPNFDKLKIKKPNINIPKIPDTVKVNFPSFTLPKKTTVVKKTTKHRQYSTESNVGGPKKKLFDFSTYPRIFKRKPKDELDDLDVTLPRKKDSPKKTSQKKESPKVIRIPLHSEESMDREDLDLSSRRYVEDIDMENDYVRESQEMHRASPFNTDLSRNRWNHGSFHGENLHEIPGSDDVKITDLDNDLDLQREIKADERSVSSAGETRQAGVVEEIDSDEFFLREKGISQDNIQMGAYLTSEIREAFKPSKIQADDSFETDQSVQEVPKRRPIKKPKRKKTPHVSKEQIPYDHESEPEEKVETEPVRPKRKPKKKKEEFIPYQETIEDLRRAVSDNILLGKEDDHHFYDGDFRREYPQMYENEQMDGIEQPNILLSDPYEKEDVILRANQNGLPEAPPRKQKSLKSLVSEHDSIIDEITYANQNKEIESYRAEQEYIIPTPEEPPQRPTRTRSRTRSQSRTNQSEKDEPPEMLSIEEPCIEEPCVQTICDYMGYAIIDKSKQRDPPLPPPPRKKRSPTDSKFFTCPRPLKDEAPIRPSRNYSTLVPKSKIEKRNEKENIDIGQYIEIEDEEGHSRLQSGDVLKRMKDRPLPAPPRPPRKTKEHSKSPLSDITNLNVDDENVELFQESEVSVQTEPLPEGFVCEELVEEKGDKVITPRQSRPPIKEFEHQETITHGALIVAPVPEKYTEGPITQFSRSTEKIITVRREVDHDINDEIQRKGLPETKIIERIIERPIQSDQVDILKAQKLQVVDLDVDRLTVNELLASKIKVSEIDSDSMKVSDINPEGGNISLGGIELSASLLKGLLGQLQSSCPLKEEQPTIEKKEPQNEHKPAKVSKSVPLKEEFISVEKESHEIESIQEPDQEDSIRKISREEAEAIAMDILAGIEQEIIPLPYESLSEEEHLIDQLRFDEQKKTPIEPPIRPPRQSHKIREEMKQLEEEILDEDIPEMIYDSTPPPRPPEPIEPFFPSQPPPSFFMLRSPALSQFIEDDIPSPPRRKRVHRQPSASSSEEVPPTRARRHRTPEPSIPQLAGQLTSACLLAGNKAFKRLIKHVTTKILRNSDGRQDLHVTVVILLVLIAGLLLLGSGGGTTVHMHHWEYFNPPRDL